MIPRPLALLLVTAACNQPTAKTDDAGAATDKTGIPPCDDLLRDLKACADKQPDARSAYDTTRDTFVGASRSGDKSQLEKNCRTFRETLRIDWGKRDGCGDL